MNKVLLLFCLLIAIHVCNCFTVYSDLSQTVTLKTKSRTFTYQQRQQGDVTTDWESTSIPDIEEESLASSWVNKLDKGLLSAMKQELVKKYMEQGMDEGSANREVEAFFRDREQAEKYVEMRMYTAAVANDVGPSTVFQLVGGFLVGFLAIAGQKLWQSWPHGN